MTLTWTRTGAFYFESGPFEVYKRNSLWAALYDNGSAFIRITFHEHKQAIDWCENFHTRPELSVHL